MQTYFYCKVWQALGYKVMASYAQQACNRTFCLTHGLNLHSNENYGLGHRFALCKPSLFWSGFSSWPYKRVCLAWPLRAMVLLTLDLLGVFQREWEHRYLCQCVLQVSEVKKKRASSCGGSCLTVPLLLKRFVKDCQICIIHATTPSSAYFPIYTWANWLTFIFILVLFK